MVNPADVAPVRVAPTSQASRFRIRPFALHRPSSVGDVVRLLGEHGERAVVMGGGVDVVNRLKAGAHCEHLIAVTSVEGLDEVRLEGGHLRIGSTVTHSQFASDTQVARLLPGVQALWVTIGSPRIRNAGTLAGNILSGAPRYDVMPIMLALGARLVFATDEPRFLTSIEVPVDSTPILVYDASHKPVVSVAVCLRPRPEGGQQLTIAVGAAHASATALALDLPAGSSLGAAAEELAHEAVRQLPVPLEDHVASAGYRQHLIRVLVQRQLSELAATRT